MTNQKTTRDSFIFYRSFYETISDLNDKQQLQIYKAIAEFSLNDNLINLDGLSKTIFRLIEPQLLANKKRYLNGLKGAEHGLKGGRPKKQDNPEAVKIITPNKPLDNPEITPNKNVNENVNVNEECKLELMNDNLNNNILIDNNIIAKKEKVKNFVKPTIDELIDYCNQNVLNVDPENFIDYYNSNGWKVGKNPMKDWQATARTWHRNNKNNNNQASYQKTNGMTAKEKANWQAFADFGNNKQTF
jgi:hypothetical protein